MKKYLLFSCCNSMVFANSFDVLSYVKNCSPNVAIDTMLAIIKTESNYNPLAININNKGQRLLYQAKNIDQATKWVNYLENNNYNFDVGIAQVNIKNIHKYGYHARNMLDPCLNLQVAAHILQKNYTAAKQKSTNTQDALYKAISAYNTGNFRSGFSNGYVKKVVYNAKNNSIKNLQ